MRSRPLLGLVVLFWGLTLRVAAAEPHPPQTLPGQFAAGSPDELMRLLYPHYDPASKSLRGEGAAEEPKRAQLWEAKKWLANKKERLVVLVSTWRGSDDDQWVTAANGKLFCDVAVLNMNAGKPVIEARGSQVTQCGGASESKLDLAPYRMTPDETLIGVRQSSMNHGFGETDLTLLRIEQTKLRPVLKAVLETTTPDEDEPAKKTTVDVVSHPGKPADFQLITKAGGKVVSRTLMVWNGTEYVEARKQGAPSTRSGAGGR